MNTTTEDAVDKKAKELVEKFKQFSMYNRGFGYDS